MAQATDTTHRAGLADSGKVTGGVQRIRQTDLLRTLLITLAPPPSSGINALFLLDAGPTDTDAYANSFFTAVEVIFEVFMKRRTQGRQPHPAGSRRTRTGSGNRFG